MTDITREQVVQAVALVDSKVGVPQSGVYGRYADAVMALYEPAIREAKAEAVREFRRDFGRKFALQDPYGHFDRATMSACHRQIEGLLDDRARQIETGDES